MHVLTYCGNHFTTYTSMKSSFYTLNLDFPCASLVVGVISPALLWEKLRCWEEKRFSPVALWGSSKAHACPGEGASLISFSFQCLVSLWGFPGGASGKEPTCQCRRVRNVGLIPWVRKIPWRRARQPIPVFLPRASHGQRSLVGYGP